MSPYLYSQIITILPVKNYLASMATFFPTPLAGEDPLGKYTHGILRRRQNEQLGRSAVHLVFFRLVDGSDYIFLLIVKVQLKG